MKIGTIQKIIIASLLLIIVAFVLLTMSYANRQNAIEMQATFKQLGLDLSGASDFLTNQARNYVQYGEQPYFKAYMHEVEVAQTRGKVVAELTRLGAPPEELALVEKAAQLSNTLAELETLAFEAVAKGDLDTARHLMFGPKYEEGKAPIVNTMQEFQTAMAKRTNDAAAAAAAQTQTALIIFSILFAVTSFVIVFSMNSIKKKMKVVGNLSRYATQLAAGNNDIDIKVTSTDEVGVLAKDFNEMVKAIREQITIAEHVADGNLAIEAHLRSDQDAMGIALKKMIDKLNVMFSDINTSSLQVSTGVKQVAGSSQALAQGAAQQAASVQELSSSISEIADKTKTNADKAEQAAHLAGAIKGDAEKGSHQMVEMMKAVKEINQSSQEIGKVIKTIDDIAFQTNILALNAAVEAARAGQHGKGFAVVAEEVRNLASRSAQAAHGSEGLIADSMKKAELGVQIATETAEILEKIVSGINESHQLVSEIARLSQEQSHGISQVNSGIDQVASVVQQNSSTAEESAAASEQMSGQSARLRELVAHFKLRS